MSNRDSNSNDQRTTNLDNNSVKYQELQDRLIAPNERQSGSRNLLEVIADSFNLKEAFENCKTKGKSPGKDHVRYADFVPRFEWFVIKQLSDSLINNRYQLGPERVYLKKKSSGEYRPIRIKCVLDRVVQRAILQVLRPVVDPKLTGLAFGGRQGLGTLHALAIAQMLIETESRWFVVSDDIAAAFDTIDVKQLATDLYGYIECKKTTRLIQKLMPIPGAMGIRQGDALSNLLLNIHLDKSLERKLAHKQPEIPLLRYVDDILIPQQSFDDAKQAYEFVKQRLSDVGLKLKADPSSAIHDLTQPKNFEWMGYVLSKDGDHLRISKDISEDSDFLKSYRRQLHKASEYPDKNLRAYKILQRLFQTLGPCHEASNHTDLIRAVYRVTIDMNYRELPTVAEIERTWRESALRWNRIRRLGEMWFQSRRINRQSYYFKTNLKKRHAISLLDMQQCCKLYLYGCSKKGFGAWACTIQMNGNDGMPLANSGAMRGDYLDFDYMQLVALKNGLSATPPKTELTILSSNRRLAIGIARLIRQINTYGWHKGMAFRNVDMRASNLAVWIEIEALLKHRLVKFQLIEKSDHETERQCIQRCNESLAQAIAQSVNEMSPRRAN